MIQIENKRAKSCNRGATHPRELLRGSTKQDTNACITKNRKTIAQAVFLFLSMGTFYTTATATTNEDSWLSYPSGTYQSAFREACFVKAKLVIVVRRTRYQVLFNTYGRGGTGLRDPPIQARGIRRVFGSSAQQLYIGHEGGRTVWEALLSVPTRFSSYSHEQSYVSLKKSLRLLQQ